MRTTLTTRQYLGGYFLPAISLVIVLIYSIAWFSIIPYIGFDFDPNTGVVEDVFVNPDPEAGLRKGDHLLQVGPVVFADYQKSLTLPLFEGAKAGDVVPLVLGRDGVKVKVNWRLPGYNSPEFKGRLFDTWLLAYVFWFFGLATVVLVRPQDTQWSLLATFCFLNAIWIIAGNDSMWKVWRSAFMSRSAIWLLVPVCLHLQWVTPKPLSKIPKVALWPGYLLATGFAVAEWFLILPKETYALGFLVAIVGGFVLLLLHLVLQPSQRRQVGFLVVAFILAGLTAVVFSLGWVLAIYPSGGVITLLALSLIPMAYFYTIYRRQPGGLELRANRIITSYTFLFLLVSIMTVLSPLIGALLGSLKSPELVGIIAGSLGGVLALVAFPWFKGIVDRHLLGIRLLPAYFIEESSTRITSSSDTPDIVRLLENELLPSMLIRQSALLRVEDGDRLVALYSSQLNLEVDWETIRASDLEAISRKYLPSNMAGGAADSLSWVRLIIPLQTSNKDVGFWLFGRRDPDDFYSQAEIAVLQTVANHIAVALVNINQTGQLSALHQANIERYEEERVQLARELHDEIMNQLAVMSMNLERGSLEDIQEGLQEITTQLRQLVRGLRPAMLIYGLYAALEELVDNLSDRVGNETSIGLEVEPSQTRYESKVEEHLYRVVQQACENALRHARATSIKIYGTLDPNQVELTVEDDGVGFEGSELLDFESLLAQKHYGLAGMYERAALIGARLKILAKDGHGARITLIWPGGENM